MWNQNLNALQRIEFVLYRRNFTLCLIALMAEYRIIIRTPLWFSR
jgi:hypothetical protein